MSTIIEQFFSLNYFIYAIPLLVTISILLLYVLRWQDFYLPYKLYRREKQEISDNKINYPKVSIVVPVYEELEQLRTLLPVLLNQNYPNFEIIIVNESSAKSISDFIERIQLSHRNVRCTFVPSTATNICKRKLSITLGIRAARSEWVIVTKVSAVPTSNKWIETLAKKFDDECDIVIGYANYFNDGSRHCAQVIYERLRCQLRYYHSVKNGAIGGDEANFCIRKTTFIKNNGYANNLQTNLGESHLLISNISNKKNTKISISPDVIVREIVPPLEIIRNIRISYREILHYSNFRNHLYLWREGLASFFIYFIILQMLAYIILRIFLHYRAIVYMNNLYCIDIFMFILAIMLIAIPVICIKKTASLFCESISKHTIYYTAILQPFKNFHLKMTRWWYRNELTHKN